MAQKKKKYRQVTLYIPEGQTLEEYMENARKAYFDEEELRQLMKDSSLISFRDLVSELEAIHKDELARQKKNGRAKKPARTAKKKK